MSQIPEYLARQADARAWEIFEQEARFGRTFRECLGQIYLVAVKAALEAETDEDGELPSIDDVRGILKTEESTA